jgi:hypothetical protein
VSIRRVTRDQKPHVENEYDFTQALALVEEDHLQI